MANGKRTRTRRLRRGRRSEKNDTPVPGKFIYKETADLGRWCGGHKSTRLRYDPDELLRPIRMRIPPAPTKTREENRGEYEEQQVYRVESLMVKGIRDVHELQQLLGIKDPRMIKRWIRRVYARWELSGTGGNLQQNKGEALKKFDMVEKELWDAIDTYRGDPRLRVVALEGLMKVQDRKLPLVGVTPQNVQASTSDEARRRHEERVAQQTALAEIATRFKTLLQQQNQQEAGGQTYDHEALEHHGED